MIRINLLPFRAARKQENVRQQISVFGLSFLLLLALLYLGNTFLSRSVSAMQSEKAHVEAELKKKEGIANEVRSMQEHLKMVQVRIDAINVLRAGRDYPVHLLDDITGLVVPKRMWLTSLDNTPQNLEITGFAIDNNTVAQFLKNLETYGAKDNRFSSVDLMQVVKSRRGGTYSELKEFRIICQKPAPAPTAEAAPKPPKK
ncbi:MAG: PilN domain-containing protein [Thermodesulfobacteriota bacterium]